MPSAIGKPHSTWYRFSIRGMLLLVLICGAFLGEWVNRAHMQREALSSIKSLDGYVLFDYQINAKGMYDPNAHFPRGPRWLHDLIGPEYFQTIYTVRIHRNFSGRRDPELGPRFLTGLTDLRSLYLTHNQVADEDLTCLESMPRLRSLSLMFCTNVGNGTAKRIEGLTELEKLYLSDTRVTDVGLTCLRGKKLRDLFLSNLQVTDAGLTHVAGVTSLQRLALNGTRVTDAGLVQLRGLSNLKELHLGGTSVTGVGIAELQKALPGTKISWANP